MFGFLWTRICALSYTSGFLIKLSLNNGWRIVFSIWLHLPVYVSPSGPRGSGLTPDYIHILKDQRQDKRNGLCIAGWKAGISFPVNDFGEESESFELRGKDKDIKLSICMNRSCAQSMKNEPQQ